MMFKHLILHEINCLKYHVTLRKIGLALCHQKI
jgi:hypothetical protein